MQNTIGWSIDKLMMAGALQQCLSHFPKMETLGKEQREVLEGFISLGEWRDRYLNAQSLSSLTRNALGLALELITESCIDWKTVYFKKLKQK